MRPWLTWLLVLLVLFVLSMIKIGVHVLYEGKKLQLELLVSKYKMILVGDEKKTNKPPKMKKTIEETEKKKQAQASKSSNNSKKQDTKPKEKGKWKPLIQTVLSYWREILSLVGRVLTTPTLDVLRLELQVGGKDSEDCAMTYGRICAIIGAVLPVVENTFGIRKRKIDVLCCFDRDSLEIAAEASITVHIYEVFALVFALLGLGLKILLESRKNKKAVQKYESSSP